MKTLVIYKSRTGFTKKYAEWICEELSCEARDYRDLPKISFDGVELLVYGGRVHAGIVDSLNKIQELAAEKHLKLVVFATGASPADAYGDVEQMWKNNKLDENTPHFYMQSGLCYEKMGAGDKLMMKMFSKMMSGKKDKTETEIGMANAIQSSYDASSRDFIKPLVEYVKKL